MNRRGQESSSLVGILLLIATLVIAITLLIMWSGVWRSAEAKTDCAAEVRSHAALMGVSNGLADPSTIRCPTRVISVNGEISAKAVIADEMVRCFEQWGRGELRLFGDEEGTYCHVCGMVYVKGAPEIRGFGSYLTTTKMPGKSVTYAESLSGVESGDLFRPSGAPAPGEDVMSTSSPIGIIFRYENGATFGTEVQNWVADPKKALPAGMAGGGVVVYAASAVGITVGAVPAAIIVVGGGLVGAAGSFTGHEPLDTIASVNARSLDPAGIASLGCDFAPAED